MNLRNFRSLIIHSLHPKTSPLEIRCHLAVTCWSNVGEESWTMPKTMSDKKWYFFRSFSKSWIQVFHGSCMICSRISRFVSPPQDYWVSGEIVFTLVVSGPQLHLFHQISVYFARVNVDLCRYTFILKNDFIHKTQDFSANFLSVFWAAILPSLQDERYTIPSITHHKNHQPIRVWDLSDL